MLFHAEAQRLQELAPEHTTPKPAAEPTEVAGSPAPESPKRFLITCRFERDGKMYGLAAPFGPGVTELTSEEIDALPVLELTARECRVFGEILENLAYSQERTIRQLESEEAAAQQSASLPIPDGTYTGGTEGDKSTIEQFSEIAGARVFDLPGAEDAFATALQEIVEGTSPKDESEAERMTDEGGADTSAVGGDQ